MTIDPMTGLITWQPARDQAGDQTVTVQATDRSGLTETQSFLVAVRNSVFSNAVPVITSTPSTAITVGQIYHYDVDATDTDGDSLNYVLISSPSGMTIDSVTGRIDWTPGERGNFPIVVGVNDGHDGQISQSYVLTVQELNLAPLITSSAIVNATARLPYHYALKATDSNGDKLTFILVTAPTGMTIDGATGVIDWEPGNTQVSQENHVTVQVTDPSGLADTQDFTITVATNLNKVPIADAGHDQNIRPGIVVNLDGSNSSDPDGDLLNYHWEFVTRPNGSAAVLLNPTAVKPSFRIDTLGKYTLQLVVNDGQVNSAPDSVTVDATVQVAAGYEHSCALTYGGKVECWGSNNRGQLGIGSFGPQLAGQAGPAGIPVPATVLAEDGTPLSGVTSISSGARFHSCALTVLGGVKCWGNNFNGTIGDGTTLDRAAAVDVLATPGGTPLTGVTAIDVGGDHSCAVTSTGGVKCWGWASHGQLGNNVGQSGISSTPVDVLIELGGKPLLSVTAVSAGLLHTCALMEDTSVKCWGNNDWGQLGNGANLVPGQGNDRIFSPVDVLIASGGAKLTGAVAITAGGFYSCALMKNGGIKCWGSNDAGTLGNGISGFGATDPAQGTISTTPVDVLTTPGGVPLTGVTAIAAGGQQGHTCAVMADSGVKCWGQQGALGMLGNGEQFNFRTTPVDVLSASGGLRLTGVGAIALGETHSCAALVNGSVKCWGNNFKGQLGNGEVAVQNAPNTQYVSIPAPRTTPVDSLLGQNTSLIAVTITPPDNNLVPGTTHQFTATGILSNGSTQNLTTSATWESSNPAVATVNAAGLVTAVSVGVTTIRATKDGIFRNTNLVVTEGVLQSIEINPKNATVLFDRDRYDASCHLGGSTVPGCDQVLLDQALTEQTFSAIGIYTDGSRLDLSSVVNWTSNASAVSINNNGVALIMMLLAIGLNKLIRRIM